MPLGFSFREIVISVSFESTVDANTVKTLKTCNKKIVKIMQKIKNTHVITSILSKSQKQTPPLIFTSEQVHDIVLSCWKM